MASFVLIHGAFQGSWVWRSTAGLLRAAGHDVLTPCLTGLGDRSHLLLKGLSLAHYVNDVVNAVCFAQCGPAILVGHSLSGFVAAAAAAALGRPACGLIYVDALIPEPGHSFLDMAGPDFDKVLMASIHDGWLVKPWPLPVFGVAGFDGAPDFAARLTSTPLTVFTARYDFGLPDPALPTVFIRCKRNSNPLIAAQAAKAQAAGHGFTEIDSGHAPMITAPGLLAEELMRCAARMPGSTDTIDSACFHERLIRPTIARSGRANATS